MGRQAGQLEGVAEAALLAQVDILPEDEVQEVPVAELVGLGAGDQGGAVIRQVGQAEPVGGLADPVGGQLAHRFDCIPAAVAWSARGRDPTGIRIAAATCAGGVSGRGRPLCQPLLRQS